MRIWAQTEATTQNPTRRCLVPRISIHPSHRMTSVNIVHPYRQTELPLGSCPIWSDPPLPVPLNKWKNRDLSSYDRNPHTNILNTSFSAINNLNGCTYNIQHAEERLWADGPPPSPSPTAILLVRGVNVYFNSTAVAVPPNCRSSKYKLGRCPTYLSCPGLATLPCSTAAITKILVKYSNESLWIRSVGPSV